MDVTIKKNLQKTACKVRMGVIEGTYNAKSGHPGGSLSIADVMTYLYFEEMNIDPANPKWEDRDRLVLSKGHTAPALYGALAEKGFCLRAGFHCAALAHASLGTKKGAVRFSPSVFSREDDAVKLAEIINTL